MIQNLKPYPAYKDSGVPWLGQVPEGWEVRRLKRCAWLNCSRAEARTELDPDTPVTFLPMERVGSDGNIKGTAVVPASAVWNGFTYFRRGDVLVAKITPCFENGKGACLDSLPTEFGFGSTEFHVLRANRSISPQFLYRVTTVAEFRRLGAEEMTGAAGQQRVPETFVATHSIVLPPLSEQAAIVRFLEYVDRRIRRYIAGKQKLIRLLEEQKQAIINRAVTRGLNPNVGLKCSGVDWLGGVPAHWEVTRLKTLLSRLVRNGVFKKKDAFGSGVPLINVADVYQDDFKIGPSGLERVQASQNEVETYRVRSGDVFFVRSSLKLEGTGRSALALDCEPDTIFECHLVQARPDVERIDARFLAILLNSFALRHYLISRANVVTMATVAQDVIASCPVLIPPMSEQVQLLQWVDRECDQLKGVIDCAQSEIALLHEYRTRLIADVVTGKVDVREAAARLPEEAGELESVEEIDEEPRDADVDVDDEMDPGSNAEE